jgi:hypothetical protein
MVLAIIGDWVAWNPDKAPQEIVKNIRGNKEGLLDAC